MRDENCIFCKIANGEIPAYTLYEDEQFRVILDRGPATKGHGLILTKEHYKDLYELGEAEGTRLFGLAKKMADKMTQALQCEGFNLVQNNGECAGQTVFHFHLHLIPRYKADGQKIGWNPGQVTDEELKSLAEKINDSLFSPKGRTVFR